MTITINAAFDSGNIRVLQVGDDVIDLEIVPDRQSDFYQWFYFRAAGIAGVPRAFRIVNAGGAAYAFGWPGYRVRASNDRIHWRMIDTRYEDGVLSFDWAGENEMAWFAYFAPYTMEQHAALVARTALSPARALSRTWPIARWPGDRRIRLRHRRKNKSGSMHASTPAKR